jgi:hypothetical protein
MEYFDISHSDSGFQIEGFPDAVKVLSVSTPMARRLADLALHRQDLSFAKECLEVINKTEDDFIREVLWRSAIVHFFKCFGSSNARSSLPERKIYASEEAFEVYSFFKNLRHRHYIHDENSYTQALPGAILNKPNSQNKIAKIVCFYTTAEVLDQPNFSNLMLLITTALSWLELSFDTLCDKLTLELEQKPYEELVATEGLIWNKPRLEDIDKNRKANN